MQKHIEYDTCPLVLTPGDFKSLLRKGRPELPNKAVWMQVGEGFFVCFGFGFVWLVGFFCLFLVFFFNVQE